MSDRERGSARRMDNGGEVSATGDTTIVPVGTGPAPCWLCDNEIRATPDSRSMCAECEGAYLAGVRRRYAAALRLPPLPPKGRVA